MSQNFGSELNIKVDTLNQKIISISEKFLSREQSQILSKLIIRAELMGVSTHGIHYFNRSVYPLLSKGVDKFKNETRKNFIYSVGRGGDVGILNLYNCLKKASIVSEKYGICMLSFKNPGKVGALRVYAEELIRHDKLLILFKNTAQTQGTRDSKQGLIGTNPMCFALPSTNFIFDSSTSCVATNSIRLMDKQNKKFEHYVGYDSHGDQTNLPSQLLKGNAYLSTFSDGPFWYKSFFLGLVIESLAALAGGNTGRRVGETKGARFNSKEGMFGIVIDKSVFPYFDHYKKEIELLFNDIESTGIRIPGSYESSQKSINISAKDWDLISSL